MNPISSLCRSASRIVAGAIFAALLAMGFVPALAVAQDYTVTKTPIDGTVAAGTEARFTIQVQRDNGEAPLDPHMEDVLPLFPGSNWDFVQDKLFGCSIYPIFNDDPLFKPEDSVQQTLTCDLNLVNGPVTVEVFSPTPADSCLVLPNTAVLFDELDGTQVASGAGKITVTGDACRPLFVIGDVEPHGVGDVVNFWGSQWWKNNFMSGLVSTGVASFKGYASDSDIFCGDGAMWESRVGNSPPPPATIPDDVMVIVTDTVHKDGPDIVGSIKQILLVGSDGKYGPNPGHRGGGVVKAVLCPAQP